MSSITLAFRRLLLLLGLAGATFATAQAQQGVGIGTTAPDASAALDIVSSTKGALLPRVADATAIASPATGLIVFQTNSPAGYYYNAGDATTPNWQQLATASGAAVTASNGLTKTGSDVALGGTLTGATSIAQAGNNFSLTGGNVGLGTTTPVTRLQLKSTAGTAFPNTTGTTQSAGHYARFSDASDLALDLGGNGSGGNWLQSTNVNNLAATYPLLFNPNGGSVGIGTTAPYSLLANTTSNIIGSDGNGVSSQALNWLTASSGYAGAFFNSAAGGAGNGLAVKVASATGVALDVSQNTGVNTSGTTLLRVGGNGNVGIGTNAPSALLDVAGSTRLRGLTTAGVVTTDASGNLGSSSATAAFGTSFIQNGTSQQIASFNVSGNGTIGASLGVGTNAPYTQLANTSANIIGSDMNGVGGQSLNWVNSSVGYAGAFYNAATSGASNGLAVKVAGTTGVALDVSQSAAVGTAGTALLRVGGDGNVGIGTNNPSQTLDVNGSTRLRGLTTAGVVTTDANGNLSSGSGSGSFVLNQTTQQVANFNVSGNGIIGGYQTVGGSLGVGTNAPYTQLANTSANIIGSDANGVSSQALNWVSTTAGYAAAFYNAAGSGVSNGLAVKVAGTSNVALDVSQGTTTSGTGTALLRVNGNGNVGIGTATPSTQLANSASIIIGSDGNGVGGQALNWVNTSSGYAGAFFNSAAGGVGNGLAVKVASATGVAFDVSQNTGVTTAGTPLLRVGGNGRVGIGTAAPSALLDVNGSTRLRGLTTAGVVTTDASGNLNSATAASLDATTASNGLTKTGVNLALGGTLTGATTIAQAGNAFSLTGGNVGIGTSSPTQPLDVNGNVRVRGLAGTGTRLPMVQADGTLAINAPVFTNDPVPGPPTTAAGSVTTGAGSNPVSVAVSGTKAYVVNSGTNTLQVFDVTTASTPALLGSISTGAGSQPLSVVVSGTKAYVVNYTSNTLQIYDVTTASAPALLGSTSTGASSSPYAVALSGTRAYVVNTGTSTLQVYDVSTNTPSLLGSIGTDASPLGLAVNGTRVYVVALGSGLLQAFDATTPSAITLLGAVASAGGTPVRVAVSGTRAYLTDASSNTLQVYNVSANTPVLLGSIGTDSNPTGVAVSGTRAFVVNNSSNTLQTFDVSANTPALFSSAATGSSPVGVAVSGTTAYVVNSGSNTLQVFAGSPSRVVQVNSDGSFSSVAVASPTLSVSGQSLSISGGNTVTLPDPTTASNGLTKTGSNFALGGTLTGATTLANGGNTLAVTGTGNTGIGTAFPATKLDVFGDFQVLTQPAASSQIVQNINNGASSGPALGQSFTLPAASIVSFTFTPNGSFSSTLTFYAGAGNGGTAISTAQSFTATAGVPVTVTLPTPLAVAAGVYTATIASANVNISSFNPYAGGSLYGGAIISNGNDMQFALAYTTGTQTLYAGNNSVGIGTNAPTAMLDVAGSTRLRGLTTAGVVTTDASGNLSSSTGSASFIQNTSTPQASSNFNISGNGTIGGNETVTGTSTITGLLTANGGTTVAGATNINTTGTAATSIGTGSTSGAVTIGRSGGTVTVPKLTTAGVVTTDASGNLSSATAASLDATTASNGLTQTGNAIALGGTLTGATTIAQAGNNFSLTGGNVGIGTSAPFTQLTNVSTASNIIGSDGNGVGAQSLNWVNTSNGYAGAFYNTTNNLTGDGLAVKILNTSAVAFDVSQGATASGTGTPLLRVNGNGNVGIGTAAPTSALYVNGAVSVPYVVATAASFPLTNAHQTVRRNGSCNTITLPDAGTCLGRLYTIINSNGTGSNVALAVAGGSGIYDDVTAATLTSLAPNNRITVQSDGGGWIVVGR